MSRATIRFSSSSVPESSLIAGPAPLPKLAMSVEEAAAAISVGSRKLRSLIALHQLSVCRVGRRVLITPTQLEELLRAHTDQTER